VSKFTIKAKLIDLLKVDAESIYGCRKDCFYIRRQFGAANDEMNSLSPGCSQLIFCTRTPRKTGIYQTVDRLKKFVTIILHLLYDLYIIFICNIYFQIQQTSPLRIKIKRCLVLHHGKYCIILISFQYRVVPMFFKWWVQVFSLASLRPNR